MVDLIPADYRRARQLQRLVLRFAMACAVSLGVMLAARAALEYALRAERAESAAANLQRSRAAAVRGRIAELEKRTLASQQTLAALDRLRGVASLDAMFVAVDQTFDARLWFRELVFAREAGTGHAESSAAPASGRAATASAAAGQPSAAPREPSERVQIRGHALDHAVLAEFVRQLEARPGIAQVRLHDTSVRSYTNAQVVDFHLELSLSKPSEASQ